jgi:nitrite reductase/ring-hydroxylating ferredoxin subunit
MTHSTEKLFVVATGDEIPPGARKIVNIEGRSIGVFNVEGEYFALRNSCPHAGGPLCEGLLSGLTVAREPGDVRYIRRGEFLRCPWHQWEFDIRSGQSWVDPRKARVRPYEAAKKKGSELLSGDVELLQAGLEKGPYKAEAYSVYADGEYIVLRL